MTPSKPIRGEIVGAFGCGVRCRGFECARWNSRCRSFEVTSMYRIVISGSVWPSNFMTAGRVTLARTISLARSEEHTSELQSRLHLVCRLLLEKKKIKKCVK